MRLWHQKLIPHLPRQQLLGQHRECCALRGLGWGKKHSTVNYVFAHDPSCLFVYHMRVFQEMTRRGYAPGKKWADPRYRGENCPRRETGTLWWGWEIYKSKGDPIYLEHNDEYLKECLDNLKKKGIEINV